MNERTKEILQREAQLFGEAMSQVYEMAYLRGVEDTARATREEPPKKDLLNHRLRTIEHGAEIFAGIPHVND